MFKKELRQDIYSSKRILEKLFFHFTNLKRNDYFFKTTFSILSKNHLCFLYKFNFFTNSYLDLICSHCGMIF